MNAKIRASIAAGEKVAEAQRQQVVKTNEGSNTKAPKNSTNEISLKKGAFERKFTAFGKTYQINDVELVK